MEGSSKGAEKKKISNWLVRIIQGIFIGSGAILPGVSGGVLCVSFGLYRPMMELFAHPKQNFRKSMPLLWPVGIGWVLGFFAFARLILLFFNADSNLATSLFFGLIVGTFPGLYKQGGKQGRNSFDALAFAVTFLLFGASFWVLGSGSGIQLNPGILSYGFCGVLWGLSVVVPGLTSSSILIFLGLFEPMTQGVVAMDWSILIPMGVGVGGTLILAARLVNRMFQRHYSRMFHVVLGFVAASTLAILPTHFKSVGEVFACLGLAAAGFAGAYLLNRLEVKE